MKYFITLVIFFNISSCINKSKHNSDINVLGRYFVSLPTIKNKSIANISSVDLVYDEDTERPVLTYLNKLDSQICYVDIISKKKIKILNLKNVSREIGINSYFAPCYIGLDSVLILSEKNKKIYFLHDTNIIATVSLKHGNSLIEPNFEPLSLSQFNLLYTNNRIYIVTTYNDIILNNSTNIQDYFSRLPELGINLSNNSKFRLGKFPTNYCNNFYYDFYPIRCLNNHNQMVYSFRYNDSLFIYNDSVLTRSISCKSQYDNSPYEAMDVEKVDQISYVKKFTIESSRYEKIIYDKFRDCYYRVYKLKQNYVNDDRNIKKNSEIVWSLMILNKDFKVIQEKLFTKGDYNYKWIIPTKAGLFISNYCEDCQKNDLLKFTMLNIDEVFN